MAAEVCARAGFAVTVFDRMPSLGRKFLMAGRGGLNLTHSENMDDFLKRYGPAENRLAPIIEVFDSTALRKWCEDLGQPTFVGSSGRIFPSSFKASPLLRAWLKQLNQLGVQFALRHEWTGWKADQSLEFLRADGSRIHISPNATILALGGASWPRLGADGRWQNILRQEKIALNTLKPANCGFIISWSEQFRVKFAGFPLKRISLTHHMTTVRGEMLISSNGFEGGAIYALSRSLRDAIFAQGEAKVLLDLRPDLTMGELVQRLNVHRRGQSTSTFLRKSIGLSPAAIALLYESDRILPSTPEALAARIKTLPFRLTGVAPIERAISTAGGVCFSEVDARLMLHRRPGVFVAGEMLDWEAPTGGYLLQACFSTGKAAGNGAVTWLNKD